jgi:polyether ionophore transport system permease protein
VNSVTGMGIAVRLILRRDGITLPIWVVALVGFVAGTASTFATSYPTPQARAEFASSIRGSPAMAPIYGPLFDDSVGGLTAWRVGVAGALLFGIFSIVTVVRHTRREEEAGRTDLLFAAFGPAVCLSVLGVAAGLAYGSATGDLGVLPAVLGTALAKLPALWVIAGLTTALFGLRPKAARAASWAVLGLVLLMELGWELGAVNHGVFATSPFAHVYPGDPVTVGSLGGLAAIALLLAAAGVAGLRRRDLT